MRFTGGVGAGGFTGAGGGVVPEVSLGSSTQKGASPASLALIVQLNWALRAVVLAAGAAVKATDWAAAVVTVVGA